jgi:hypothetical protein
VEVAFLASLRTIIDDAAFRKAIDHLPTRLGHPPGRAFTVAYLFDAHIKESPLPERAALVQESVRDIWGETHQPYLTFRDGWRCQ